MIGAELIFVNRKLLTALVLIAVAVATVPAFGDPVKAVDHDTSIFLSSAVDSDRGAGSDGGIGYKLALAVFEIFDCPFRAIRAQRSEAANRNPILTVYERRIRAPPLISRVA